MLRFNGIFFFFFSLSFLAISQTGTDNNFGDVKSVLQKVEDLKNRNQINQAISILKEIEIKSDSLKNYKALVDIYNDFAILFYEQDNVQNAKFMLDRSKSMLSKVTYPYGAAKSKSVEALIAISDNKIHLAKSLLHSAHKLTNDRNLLNHILLYDGLIYLKQKNLRAAKKNFNALIVNEDLKNKQIFKVKGYLYLGSAYQAENDFVQANKNALLAYQHAEKNDFILQQLEAGKLAADSYELLENYPAALNYQKKIANLSEIINKAVKVKAREDHVHEEFVDVLKNTINSLNSQLNEVAQSEGRFKITAILTTGFLIIISLLAISLFRTNQIKVSTNDLLVKKNKELIVARDEAEKAMQAKTQFLSTVSHELRTPLYAVTGLTHLLIEEDPKKSQLEHLKSLKFSGDYLLAFINDILQINKIEADKLKVEKANFGLQKLLSEVVLSMQQTAKEKSTVVSLDIDSNIPHVLIGDTVKLSQILINLVGNALKFTEKGEVSIISKLLQKTESHSRIYFEVKDNGIGISEDMQANIFESFEQGSIQINRKYGGTGLGLTIVKSLLNLFESEIKLKSKLGEGSSFYFEIEFQNVAKEEDQQQAPLETDEHLLEGLHLLLVEDNKINQVITSKMLLKKRITSDIANNGYEAIDLAKENTYDGILMDIHMPGISGVVATEEIRKFNKDIPIIALTAISLDDSTEHFYMAGCNDVVTKPFKPEIFYQRIAENIVHRKHNEASKKYNPDEA
ncbi:MAG: ATP-binding protein [Flavobacteriaceae bacterium]|nr:ATP-binding protein [Flavobacteriaceae bacterium]